MSDRIRVERVKEYTDIRGLVFEPMGPEALADQKNVHVTLTEPGCVRGNHYHRKGSEVSVVLGPALVRYQDGDDMRELLIPEGEVHRFWIPPGIAHAFQNPGPGPMLLVGFNTEAHDPSNPDVVPHVLIEV